MALESATDLLSYFDTDEFAVSATYTPSGGSASTVRGIFDNAYFEPFRGEYSGIESSETMFTCRTSDVSSVAHGDSVVIASVTYLVRGVQPDGTGITKLMLEQQ